MPSCGLLGEKLGHSYSPRIHALLGSYEYELYEKRPEELEAFLTGGSWTGLNVTIPYKKAVIPFCDELSAVARTAGSVNTLVRRPDGTLFGDSTDGFGFACMVRGSGVDLKGEKVLILGSGGACAAVRYALTSMGARPVVISRTGPDNYGNLFLHRDAGAIVNTTPVGMYPDNGRSPLGLDGFDRLKAVFDIIYNPERTALMMDAEERGVPSFGGLTMLVAQAKRSSELFSGHALPNEVIERVTARLAGETRNLVLIGMPGCGKTTIAALLGKKTGRDVLDSDCEIVQNRSLSIPEIFAAEGESVFREYETQALERLGRLSGKIISTGGGSVLREENYRLLHQNSVIVWLTRDLSRLARGGRPLSENSDLAAMYRAREPRYRRFADLAVSNDGTPEQTVERILEALP
ncbi:MAG: shikimate kinase [Oscillospiraceae bacterium]|nr:shikimate kinase [Oscillospiraceae bacterium]